MKRVFGIFEAIFDGFYLITAFILSLILLLANSPNDTRILAGIMSLILVGGDAFHLLPRILLILTQQEEKLRHILGIGKQITSITMTLFYLLLWQIGLSAFSPDSLPFWSYFVYLLAGIRIFLCLLPQNGWQKRYPPAKWGILRNIPFFLLGLIVAGLFFLQRNTLPGLSWMWLAIILSFIFYLPVVLWVNKNSKIGMLMLPKTCTYLWMLFMCMSL